MQGCFTRTPPAPGIPPAVPVEPLPPAPALAAGVPAVAAVDGWVISGSPPGCPTVGLIELPSPKQNVWIQSLINQLVVWEPQGMTQRQKTDLVMALWFTEIAVQRLLGHGRSTATHLENKWASRGALKQRGSINLLDHLTAAQAA